MGVKTRGITDGPDSLMGPILYAINSTTTTHQVIYFKNKIYFHSKPNSTEIQLRVINTHIIIVTHKQTRNIPPHNYHTLPRALSNTAVFPHTLHAVPHRLPHWYTAAHCRARYCRKRTHCCTLSQATTLIHAHFHTLPTHCRTLP